MMEKVAAAGCCLDVVSGRKMAIAKERIPELPEKLQAREQKEASLPQ